MNIYIYNLYVDMLYTYHIMIYIYIYPIGFICLEKPVKVCEIKYIAFVLKANLSRVSNA